MPIYFSSFYFDIEWFCFLNCGRWFSTSNAIAFHCCSALGFCCCVRLAITIRAWISLSTAMTQSILLFFWILLPFRLSHLVLANPSWTQSQYNNFPFTERWISVRCSWCLHSLGVLIHVSNVLRIFTRDLFTFNWFRNELPHVSCNLFVILLFLLATLLRMSFLTHGVYKSGNFPHFVGKDLLASISPLFKFLCGLTLNWISYAWKTKCVPL